MMKFNPRRVLTLGCALVCALALKHFYSTASAGELRWILGPTIVLVEAVTGRSFEFEPGAGYINKEQYFLIASSCSGVNFLITAFLMLSIRWSLPWAAGVAYLATLIANTARISVAMQIQHAEIAMLRLSPEGVHRLEGILIYFGCLLILFAISEGSISSLIRRAWIPLLVYYGAALGIPIANGAFQHGSSFWEHSLFVLMIPMLMFFAVRFLPVGRLSAR